MQRETVEKSGIQFGFESRGGWTRQVELVRGSYENGETAVAALLSDPAQEDFGQLWSSITVNLGCELQDGATVLLDTNNMDDGLLRKVLGLGSPTGDYVRSGFCAYPAFTFDADVMENMRDLDEFFAAKHVSLSEGAAAIEDALRTVYGDDVPRAAPSDPDMDQSVRDWYLMAYPEDDLGLEIEPTFSFAAACAGIPEGGDFYLALGVEDSLVRERVFSEIAARKGLCYGDVYEAWLQGENLPEGAMKRNEADTLGARACRDRIRRNSA